jgi:hypothetical protein
MAGAFAAALIFYMLMIAEIMLGLFVVCYACHTFLTVLQDTAAGNDEATWPDEPLQDWMPRGAYLLGLIAVILAPVGFLRVVLRSNGVTENLLLPLLATGGILLWLAFPVCILSSLSGTSRLFILRAQVLGQLLRIPGAVVILYLVSAVLFAGLLALGYLTLLDGWFYLLPVTAVALTAGLMVYGRLLGRIAWLVSELKPAQRTAREQPRTMQAVRSEAHDPWADPARKRKRKKRKIEKTPSIHLPVDGYNLADEPPTAPASEPPLDGCPAVGVEAFDVQDAPNQSPTKGNERPTPWTDKVERELAFPSQLPPPPERPMLSGVYSFPWYPSSRRVLVILSAGFFFMGVLAVLMIMVGLPGQ